jgi:hypothetical protein
MRGAKLAGFFWKTWRSRHNFQDRAMLNEPSTPATEITRRATLRVAAAINAQTTDLPLSHLGSEGDLRALQAGAIDIGLISRPLRPEESAAGLVASLASLSPAMAAALAHAHHQRTRARSTSRFIPRPAAPAGMRALAAIGPRTRPHPLVG